MLKIILFFQVKPYTSIKIALPPSNVRHIFDIWTKRITIKNTYSTSLPMLNIHLLKIHYKYQQMYCSLTKESIARVILNQIRISLHLEFGERYTFLDATFRVQI
jgi:hypothetical protein